MYFALLDELYDEMLRYIEDLGRRIYIYLKQAALYYHKTIFIALDYLYILILNFIYQNFRNRAMVCKQKDSMNSP